MSSMSSIGIKQGDFGIPLKFNTVRPINEDSRFKTEVIIKEAKSGDLAGFFIRPRSIYLLGKI